MSRIMALAVPVIQNARAVLEEDCSINPDCQLISSTVQTMTRPQVKPSMGVHPEEWHEVRYIKLDTFIKFLYIKRLKLL